MGMHLHKKINHVVLIFSKFCAIADHAEAREKCRHLEIQCITHMRVLTTAETC